MIPPLTDTERIEFRRTQRELKKVQAQAEKFQRKYDNLKEHALRLQQDAKYERQGRKADRELTQRIIAKREDLLFLALQRGALDFQEAVPFKNAMSMDQVKAWYLERLSALTLGETE